MCRSICVGIFFIGLGKFASMILLHIFSRPLSRDTFSSSISITLRFGVFIVSQISLIFHIRNFLESIFSLTYESISSTLSSMTGIFSSMSYILLVMFAPVPVCSPQISISRVPSLCVFFVLFLFSFFPSPVCYFLGFLGIL